MLRLVELLGQEPDFPRTRIIFMVLVSGLAGGAMLAAINEAAAAIAAGVWDPQYFVVALVLLILVVYTQHQSLINIAGAVEEVVLKLRLRIGNLLRHAEPQLIEAGGTPALYVVLAKDNQLISQAALSLTLLARSVLVVVVGLLYLGWFSLWALAAMLAFCGVYGFLYARFIFPNATAKLKRSQDPEKRFLERLQELCQGRKEIRLSRLKNDALFEHYGQTAGEVSALKRGVDTEVANGITVGNAALYLLLIVLVTLLPGLDPVLTVQVFRITATILFLLAELNPWLTWVPEIIRADAALEALCGLEEQLQRAPHDETALRPAEPLRSFAQLRFEGVEFRYLDQHGEPCFPMGPIDLAVEPGELLFIVGRNGSGKTTLLKLLAGLYYPSAGVIRVDDRLIDAAVYPAYRELFSAVFDDFFLFERLYGSSKLDLGQLANWLEVMGLTGKTSCVDGKFRTLNLSGGETRRLAFAAAVSEGKPIVLVDDVAMDQDPEFREKFYREVLPGLKRAGKTVVAVVRDERYFDAADRVLRLEAGRVAEATP